MMTAAAEWAFSAAYQTHLAIDKPGWLRRSQKLGGVQAETTMQSIVPGLWKRWGNRESK